MIWELSGRLRRGIRWGLLRLAYGFVYLLWSMPLTALQRKWRDCWDACFWGVLSLVVLVPLDVYASFRIPLDLRYVSGFKLPLGWVTITYARRLTDAERLGGK